MSAPSKPTELHSEATDMRSPAAARKEAQRQRDAAMGLVRTEIKLSARQMDMVKFGCLVRGGLAEPYGLNEYMATLVLRDHELLQAQLAAVQGTACDQCGKPLPQGCGGEHPGYATCAFTRGPQSLLL